MSDNNLRVGFIGLGIMGGPMALNCRKAGFDVTVYNRSPAKVEPLRQAGAGVAGSPAEIAATCDIVLSCVTNSRDVLQVMLEGPQGVLAGVRPGTVVADHSTVSPETAVTCAEALAKKGAGFLDAPVSGGDVGAKAGTLSIMVGGRKEDFDRALPVFQAMGKTITYCGSPGAGYVVKLCNQILGGLHLVAAAEAILLASAAGIDLKAMLQAVTSGAGNSWILSNLGPKMIAGNYQPGFFIDYQLKDLHLAAQAAHDLNTPLPASALAENLFRAASANGLGRNGTQAIYELVKKLAKR